MGPFNRFATFSAALLSEYGFRLGEWRGASGFDQGEGIPEHHNQPLRTPGTMMDNSACQPPDQDIRALEDALEESLERRIRERTAQLEVANAELETFSYSVSHDLRAPLRAIDGFCRILQEDYADRLDEQGRHYLERVGAATTRMGVLITDLLTLSQVSHRILQRVSVDLTDLAHTIAADLRQQQPTRNVTFVIADGLRANGDAHLVRVVLENLLGNSWKYTSKHAAARIEMGATAREGGRVYFVRDDGVGFDMHDAAKLFTPFERLHKPTEFEGTGIGLATVRRITHFHGGRVWADSRQEHGTTISFTLEP